MSLILHVDMGRGRRWMGLSSLKVVCLRVVVVVEMLVVLEVLEVIVDILSSRAY